MSRGERMLLEALSDGLWHVVYDKLPRGISVHTVKQCIERGLVKTEKVNLKLEGVEQSYYIALHIRRRGRAALERVQKHPILRAR